MWYVVCFVAGLIIGWNVLPQPAWIKVLYDKLKHDYDEIRRK